MLRRVDGRGLAEKLLLSIAVLGVAAVLAGPGTFAAFTSSTNASQPATSGTVTVALGATNAVTNRLALAATGVVPGDTIQRSFDLANTGNQGLAVVALTTTASPSSPLDTDAANGLQMVLDRCSSTWTESGTSPAFTYTCGGMITTIIGSRPAIGSNLTMAGLSTLAAAGTDHLRVTLTLPTTADNTFQGLTSTITYSFAGTQRAASAH